MPGAQDPSRASNPSETAAGYMSEMQENGWLYMLHIEEEKTRKMET